MQYLHFRSAFKITGILSVVVFPALSFAGPGFGTLRKKEIELKIRQPAVVRLANTSVAFTGKASNPEYGPVKDTLLATLETELISNEKTLVVKDKTSEAEWVIGVDVTGYSTPHSTQRTENNGTNSVTTYTRWVGSLNAAYRVLDRNGRVYDAGNVDSAYDEEFSNTSMPSNFHFPLGLGRTAPKKSPGKKPQTPPATPDEVKQILVKDVVSQIASKLGNTTQAIRVQVAGGEEYLDRAATFMGQQLWTRASDELEKASPFSKQEDESFRQYDLGVIYEAIAYDSKTFSDQKANIFKASEYYDKALELNPKQKYFVETVARSKDAIARFKALDAMQLADKKAAQKTETAQPDGKSRPARTLTASDVVELYTAGVDEEQIKDAIEKSSLQFDPFDKDTMLKIKKSKLPITIQNEMRKKVGAPLLHTPSEPATRNAAKKTS